MAATSSSHGKSMPDRGGVSSSSGTGAGEDPGGGAAESSGKPAPGRVAGDGEAEADRGDLPSGDGAAESIASGIASVLGPVVRTYGVRVDDAVNSQRTLETSINRLTQELDLLLDATPLPLEAQQAARLSGIRKRVSSLSGTLQTIQERINKMNGMLSKKSAESQG